MKREFTAIAFAAIGAAALALLAFLVSGYWAGLLAIIMAYTVASLAQNLLTGYADIPSLGNVAFFATSAYVAAGLMADASVPWLPALIAGVLAAGILGFAIGLPALRISGMHLAIVTVAIVFAGQEEVLAQRDQGEPSNVISVFQPSWLLQDKTLYVAAVILAVAAYLIVWNLLRSRSGRAIRALGENPLAAASIGINVTLYRLLACVISGMITGAAGLVYLYHFQHVSHGNYTLTLSLAFLTMMIVGGSRSLGGSFLGAAVIGMISLLPQFLPSSIGSLDVQQSVQAAYAILLLLALKFFPDGIWNVVGAGMDHFLQRRKLREAVEETG